MKPVFVTLSVMFLSTLGIAQPNPDTLWTRTYGGNEDEVAYSVQQTTDGGYIVAGSTRSFGAGYVDSYLVKTNAQGDTLWTQCYGGSEGDEAKCVRQTSDGGYIVAGYTQHSGAGGYDFHLVKTDGFGDTLWTRRYGGSLEESANSVQQTTDGGYILAGHTWSFGAGSSDFYLVKTDSQGDTLWTRRYGGSGGDWASCVQQTADGGYILAGETQSFGTGSSGFLVKTNSSGDTIWTRFYGGVSVDGFSSIQQTADGGYIAAGRTWSYGVGTYDFYLVKTNSQGDTLWTRTFGGFFVDEAYSVQQTADGGYVVAGSTQSFGAGAPSRFNFYIVKTNSQGDSLWTRTYGDGLTWEVAYSVQQTTDGGYIIAGHRELSGIDEGGCWLIKTGPDQLDAEPIRVKTPNEYVLHPNLPNPFNASTQIIYELPRAGRVTLAVFNLLGEEVARLVDEVQVAGMHTVAFDGSGVASGVYLCRLQAEGRVQARKMVLLK